MLQQEWWLNNISKNPEGFADWLGDTKNISRIWIRDFIKKNKVKAMLDVACGPCIDAKGLLSEETCIKYKGTDISEYLIKENNKDGFDCEVGNIEDIKEEDNSWELVYARHIIEHLEYYEKAVKEMCRVAKDYVVIIHFIPMSKDSDKIMLTDLRGEKFHENHYDHDKFVEFCSQFGTVQRIDLNDMQMRQTITLIRIKG